MYMHVHLLESVCVHEGERESVWRLVACLSTSLACLSPRQVHSWGLMASGVKDLPLNAFKVTGGRLPTPSAPGPAPCPRH